METATVRRFSLRQVVLALVLIGTVGLGADLLLTEHTESFTQWIPLIILGAAFASAVTVAVRPTPRALAIFQGVMGLCMVAGLLGLYLHYAGNVEFALERDSALSGGRLVWKALRGATPALAPAALAQLGLLGLAYTYGHPALIERNTRKNDAVE